MAKSKNSTSLLLGGIFAGVATIVALGLLCVTLFGVGYYLIQKYNKPNTPLLKDLQPMQYVGIFLCVLGALPFIQYFFMGFLFNAGESVFSSMFE